jgi:hypothetical protein
LGSELQMIAKMGVDWGINDAPMTRQACKVRDEALGMIPGRTASSADLGLCISHFFPTGTLFSGY